MTDECIKRESVLKCIAEDGYDCDYDLGYWSHNTEFQELIKAIPAADVVEVIRCRDCKYRLEDNFCTGRGWPKQMVADDGFCEKGKRKDGDGE